MVTVLAFVSIAEDAPEALAAYFKVMGPLLQRAGAKIVNRFAVRDVMMGARPAQTVVIVEYPSREAVDMVFHSPEYAALTEIRQQAFHDYAIRIVDKTSGKVPAEHVNLHMAAQTKRAHGCEIIAGKTGFLNRSKSGEGEDPELVNCEDQFAS